MGAGSYGVVYGEPGLPAIDAQGRTPILPPDQYVSKVFLDGKFIGGYQELLVLKESGKLIDLI